MQAAKKKKHKRRGAHGPRGPRGLVGPKGDTGPSGPPGPPGQAGLTGSARAYAYVAAGSGKPSLDPARTKGFTGVAKGSLTGIYCLTPAAGIDPASSVALVSVVYNSAFANEPEEADPAYDVCPAGHFGVYTFSGAPRSGTPNLDFTIAVP